MVEVIIIQPYKWNAANTTGGGGGGAWVSSTVVDAGGSGVVILRYPSAYAIYFSNWSWTLFRQQLD